MTIRAMTCTLVTIGALLVCTMYAAAAEQSTEKAAAAPQEAAAMPKLPEGHPPLPAGHPPLAAVDGEQAPTIGTLTIVVGQGTKGGPHLPAMPSSLSFTYRTNPPSASS